MMERGPCAKQVVTATIITRTGKRFVGRNDCNNAQPKCPRADMPTGTGYELCRDICQQPAHAEIDAITQAMIHLPSGMNLLGASMFIEGHTYVCANCKKLMLAHGISEHNVYFAPPLAEDVS